MVYKFAEYDHMWNNLVFLIKKKLTTHVLFIRLFQLVWLKYFGKHRLINYFAFLHKNFDLLEKFDLLKQEMIFFTFFAQSFYARGRHDSSNDAFRNIFLKLIGLILWMKRVSSIFFYLIRQIIQAYNVAYPMN